MKGYLNHLRLLKPEIPLFLIVWLFGPITALTEWVLEEGLNLSYEKCHPFSVRVVLPDFILSGFPNIFYSTVSFLEFLLPILLSAFLSIILHNLIRESILINKSSVLWFYLLFTFLNIFLSIIVVNSTNPEICSIF